VANNSRQNHYQAVLAGHFSPSEIDDGLMQPAGIDNLNQDPIDSAVRISMPPRLGHNLLAHVCTAGASITLHLNPHAGVEWDVQFVPVAQQRL
jgi:hypothetical protein